MCELLVDLKTLIKISPALVTHYDWHGYFARCDQSCEVVMMSLMRNTTASIFTIRRSRPDLRSIQRMRVAICRTARQTRSFSLAAQGSRTV